MIKLTLTSILFAFVAYVALCAVLYSMQRAMLYYPTLPVTSHEAEELWLENEGVSLKVWHIPARGAKALIYFGGNAEDVALNIPPFKRLFPDHNIYLHNYRGYGGSKGKPTEDGLFSDALALYDHVRKQHADIAVMGRSLGTSVAVYLASQKATSSLALVTPFDSMTNVAASFYPYVPVAMLLRDRYDSYSRVDKLKIPTLILVAEHDEVIPRKHTDNLIAVMKPTLTTVETIADTSHNTIGSSPAYERALSRFFTHQRP